ncbi:hypothetical protein BBJ29_003118 [Phytophthora kernoviae]|uniref:Uncharacterized protein n=1 Tax=Phytophthora kernoviae TaxID=325452 RepID=A0A3F2RYU2_9STRA|nr:hypothetical protein BBJ29_003118 [Phytophthora kernoviae]RLN66039.1 hypothetical protein BBP00_00002494 [Phytophthora kernoviae]
MLRRAKSQPDLSFLPLTTQQQVQDMLVYIQNQKQLQQLPRVDGIRLGRIGTVESCGIGIQLVVLKKNVGVL